MCGLTGFLTAGLFAREDNASAILSLMADTIVSRGPDSSGFWHDS